MWHYLTHHPDRDTLILRRAAVPTPPAAAGGPTMESTAWQAEFVG
ncbi:hypothetical protein AB0J82_39115 [Asanoa sp. NPDC049518]